MKTVTMNFMLYIINALLAFVCMRQRLMWSQHLFECESDNKYRLISIKQYSDKLSHRTLVLMLMPIP